MERRYERVSGPWRPYMGQRSLDLSMIREVRAELEAERVAAQETNNSGAQAIPVVNVPETYGQQLAADVQPVYNLVSPEGLSEGEIQAIKEADGVKYPGQP